MQLHVDQRRSVHLFAGCGGDICGLTAAGWSPALAVEVNKWRCQTLRLNYGRPGLTVFEGPIQSFTLEAYPPGALPLYFLTFPCDHYTVAANIHGKWTGDALYLEALREIVLRFLEVVVLENVLGMRKFKRVMETFRALPLYQCTEFTLHGEDFTHQRKARLFVILTRQTYDFPPLETYRQPRPGIRLGDYLEAGASLSPIPAYVYTRMDGAYRDQPRIYDPAQAEPVNLFTNYGRDRSLFLVRDPRAPRGVRPFSLREVANLAGFPHWYQFVGPINEAYDMVVDCVMPAMAHAIGAAVNDYIAAIPQLAEVPTSLGYREVRSVREKELAEALAIVREPEQVAVESWPSAVQQIGLWEIS